MDINTPKLQVPYFVFLDLFRILIKTYCMRFEDDLDSLLSADTSFVDKTVFFLHRSHSNPNFCFQFQLFVVFMTCHDLTEYFITHS